MKSPTLHDVAQLAGVSYATADRVLNQRGNVAAKSVTKVEAAVAQLGYVRNIAAANLSKNRTYRLAFVLPHRSNAFFGRMHDHLDQAKLHLKADRIAIDVIEFKAFEIDALQETLIGLAQAQYDGIAIVGLQHDRIKAPLDALRAAGTKVVSLVSDLPESCRDYYIGIDNNKAGRTAARLIGMAHAGAAGQVLVTAGSLDALDHFDRLHGFRNVLERDFPNLILQDVSETRDDPQLMRETLVQSLGQPHGITALYNVGAGNDGLIDALRVVGRPDRFCCIVHELSQPTRQALLEGAVDVAIDQRPEIELNRALAALRALLDGRPPPPSPELIPAIYLRDNLPDETIQ